MNNLLEIARACSVLIVGLYALFGLIGIGLALFIPDKTRNPR